MFYPAKKMAGTGKPLGISVIKFVEKIVESDFFFLCGLFWVALYLFGKKKIGQGTPADHPAVNIREAVGE